MRECAALLGAAAGSVEALMGHRNAAAEVWYKEAVTGGHQAMGAIVPVDKPVRVPWSLAGRLLIRDWRSGEVLVLLASLSVAVAAMTAVAFFTDRVRQAVTQEAAEVLAADLRVESVTPLSTEYLELADSLGMESAEVVHFRSVVVAGEVTALADVRGATAGYPLRGEVQVADDFGAAAYVIDGAPAPGEVWAEPGLLARLDIGVGDVVSIGSAQLRVAHTLEFRPDEGWRLMEIAPTVLLNLDDLRSANLIQPGSIIEYEQLFAGSAEQVTQMREALELRLSPEEELDDIRDARPEVRASLDQAERFLVLAALVCVLLGAVAVAMSARRFVSRRLDAVALMKCIGAQYRDVLRLNLTQLSILVLIAAVLGSLVGFAAQFGLTALLADFVEASLPEARLAGAAIGPVTALMIAVGFALPPLLQLGKVPPARVLRKDVEPPSLHFMTIYLVAIGCVVAMLQLLFRDLELIAYIVGGTLVVLTVLYLAGRLLVASLNRMRGGVGVAWRYGIANVARRGSESSIQIVAFGIGLMVLLLLTFVRTQLMTEWQTTLQETAPNQFLINIQPSQVADIQTFLTSAGLEPTAMTPLVRARISHVNGVPLADYEPRDERARREFNDEINLTWSATPGEDNEIVRGQWWDDDTNEALLSIEEDLLEELGLSIGDELTYAIGGESLTVRIASERRVNWESFRPNFFMVVNPGQIEGFAHTYITSMIVAPEHSGVMLDLIRQFPSVSVIDIGAVLNQVRAAMDQAAAAVQYVFLFTLASGIMVLLAAIQATRDERLFESAVLRTLGARRMVILKGVAAEFTALGLLAGVLAAIGAATLAWVIANQLFNLDFVPDPLLWFVGVLLGAGIVGVSGTLAVRSVINSSPVAVLRAN
jgi:putative ABC transport system permease protein